MALEPKQYKGYVVESEHRCPHHRPVLISKRREVTSCEHPRYVNDPAIKLCEGPNSKMCPLPIINVEPPRTVVNEAYYYRGFQDGYNDRQTGITPDPVPVLESEDVVRLFERATEELQKVAQEDIR